MLDPTLFGAILGFDDTVPEQKLVSWVGSPSFQDSVLTYSFDTLAPYNGTISNPVNYISSQINTNNQIDPPSVTTYFDLLSFNQQSAVNYLLEQDPSDYYRVSFSDVSNLQFSNTTGVTTGDIALLKADILDLSQNLTTYKIISQNEFSYPANA